MLKLSHHCAKSQHLDGSDVEIASKSNEAGGSPSLSAFFDCALQENSIYYASRQGKRRFTSPLFRLVQRLKSHPILKKCTATEAFSRLNNELSPDWGKLFPDVALPSLEFVTAWDQINIPAGMSPLLLAGQRAMNKPLTLCNAPICEGYEKYLATAFHLQRLTPRRDILLPVHAMSGLLSKLLGKNVSEQSVSNYSRLAKKEGYIKLREKAHRVSGKAAQYQFDLRRFTDAGVELDPTSAQTDSDCIHGIHGVHGTNGSESSSFTAPTWIAWMD
jgi:hypothetical protein